jgi:hypothetical protein
MSNAYPETLMAAAPLLQGWDELLELLERQRDHGELCTLKV